jgi:methionine biosynthesis protein MetW
MQFQITMLGRNSVILIKRIYRFLRYRMLFRLMAAWRNVFCYKPMKFSAMDYEEYWAGEHSTGVASDSRVRQFLRLIDRGASVIEIGCGDGNLLALLKDHSQVQGKGYDVSTLAVSKARSRGVKADVRDATVCGLQEGESADYIVIADCLEHLPNPESLLQQLRGKFHKYLLISIPNSCYWRYRLRVLFGSFMVQWVAHPGEHLRFWSISDMRWWLEELGFIVRNAYPTWGIPILKHFWPGMFAQNVIYLITEMPCVEADNSGQQTLRRRHARPEAAKCTN